MADNVYDAIVIGSGISGGWAAKELTEKGMKTLMLERGRNIEHVKDYVNANKEAWDYPHRGRRTQQMINDYPVLKRDYPLNETNLDYWVNEKDGTVMCLAQAKDSDAVKQTHKEAHGLLPGYIALVKQQQ